MVEVNLQIAHKLIEQHAAFSKGSCQFFQCFVVRMNGLTKASRLIYL